MQISKHINLRNDELKTYVCSDLGSFSATVLQQDF